MIRAVVLFDSTSLPSPSFGESAEEYAARSGAFTESERSRARIEWRAGLDAAWRRWRDADRKRALADMLLTPEPEAEPGGAP